MGDTTQGDGQSEGQAERDAQATFVQHGFSLMMKMDRAGKSAESA
jgi:hypothetical protein